MDSPLLTLMFLSLGVFSSFLVPLVESQRNVIPGEESSPSPAPSPRPPPSPPPHPPPSPPPPSSPRPRPPPLSRRHSPTGQKTHLGNGSPPPKKKLNLGKKVGLIFAGIAVFLQVGVVVFLVIKRRQLLKNHHQY